MFRTVFHRIAVVATGLAFLAVLVVVAPTADHANEGKAAAIESSNAAAFHWPTGSEVLGFENLEGAVFVQAHLVGANGRDTTGWMIVDTGAGMLALDRPLASWLELSDANAPSFHLTERALPRIELGHLQIDQVSPVMAVDLEAVGRVTDRPVLGLIGESLFRGRALYLDYANEIMAVIPAPADSGAGVEPPRAREQRSRQALGGLLGKDAVAVPVRVEGDGKLVVRGRVSDPAPKHMSRWLTLAIDTGATKGVLFEETLVGAVDHLASWPRLDGFAAQNLYGAPDASLARVPRIELETRGGVLSADGVVMGLMSGPLARVLAQAVGETVHGVIGYSFLRRFSVVVDYPRRVMWLERRDGSEERPFEYSHVGIQLERLDRQVRVHAVASGAPADEAGIRAGDVVRAIDGEPVKDLDLVEVSLLLEGPPGSKVWMTVERDGEAETYELTRRQLL